MEKNEMVPVIICCGGSGRAVVYGYANELPKVGEACELHHARMVLRWSGSGGLFNVAANGPSDGSRITSSVDVLRDIPQQVLSVSKAGAKALDEWPNA